MPVDDSLIPDEVVSDCCSSIMPTRSRPRYRLPLVLFVLTFVSALVAYVIYNINARDAYFTFLVLKHDPGRIWDGLIFAATLMFILSAHEMGHFIIARKYRVQQSLPYFIPAPNVFGTLGALILMRTPPPNRRVLLRVAFSGPFVGTLFAIPALFWGLAHSTPIRFAPFSFGHSFLLKTINNWSGIGLSLPELELHPVALAGWVGLFVTMLNLIPVGQLDGGHIIFALLGRKQKWISLPTIGVLFAIGLSLGWKQGGIWILWSVFLVIIGRKTPSVIEETVPLGWVDRLLAIIAILIFLITFIPIPLQSHQVDQEVKSAPQRMERNNLPRYLPPRPDLRRNMRDFRDYHSPTFRSNEHWPQHLEPKFYDHRLPKNQKSVVR